MYNDIAKEFEQMFKNARKQNEQKKRMREIMQKYGESVLDIENNIPQNEYYEYILAGGRDMLEKVKQENLQQQNSYSTEDIEEEDEEEEIIDKNILKSNLNSNTKSSLYKKTQEEVKNDNMRINQTMGNQLEDSPRHKKVNYQLGTLNAEYESNNNPSAIGYDKTGGYSYGKYQIATKTGTMNDYLKYLNRIPEYKSYAETLNNAGGSNGASTKSSTFKNAWIKLAKDEKFNQSQKQYIIQTLLNPLLKKVKDIEELDVENRHPVIKDVLYSIATQHGGSGGAVLLHNVFKNISKDQALTDEELIELIYNERSKVDIYFKNSSPEYKNNLKKHRFPQERAKALRLLNN